MHAATRQIDHSRGTLRRAWFAAAACVACLVFPAAFDRIGAQSPAPALSGRVASAEEGPMEDEPVPHTAGER